MLPLINIILQVLNELGAHNESGICSVLPCKIEAEVTLPPATTTHGSQIILKTNDLNVRTPELKELYFFLK